MKKRLISIIEAVLISLWGTQLFMDDSFYVNYLIILIASLVCLYLNKKYQEKLNKKQMVLVSIFTLLFVGMTSLAAVGYWKEPFELSILVIGGSITFYQIFKAIALNIKKLSFKADDNSPKDAKRIFIATFLILSLSRILILFLCFYPGVLTGDSIDQVNQMQTGNYLNHHPVYHTQFMHLFIALGQSIFGGNLNAGIAFYSVAQIAITSLIVAFTLSTIARMKIPKVFTYISAVFYTFMPYHIMYSFTLWKDILFGYIVLLFIVAAVRYAKRIGNDKLNLLLLIISGVGTVIFRSNGLFVLVLVAIFVIIFYHSTKKKLIITIIASLALGFFMQNVLLKWLNVKSTDIVESLSIPIQQISGTISDGKTITDEEKDILRNVVDLEQVPKEYKTYISDPIKTLIRKNGGSKDYIKEHKVELIRTYLSIGLRNPFSYLKAYSYQTRGYYDSGYKYGRWSYIVQENKLGIERQTNNKQVEKVVTNYNALYEKIDILKPFISIGMFTWLLLLLLFIAIAKQNKLGIFISLPALFVILSLLVATPVFAEFRYAYSSFTVLPFVAATVFCSNNKKDEK